MPNILSGVRVLDLTRFVAGPWCTTMMADLGAEVIKIESPGGASGAGGDGARYYNDVFGYAMSSYFVGLNRNKRSVVLDVQSDRGKALLWRLIDRSDILINNFRPGVMARLGFSYPVVHERNDRIIYVELSAFGPTGPYRGRPGMDGLLQAMGGIMGLTGERDGGPVRIGAPVADYTGAFLALAGTAMALFERERTHQGRQVTLSLLDGQVAMLANLLPGFAVTGKPDSRLGAAHQQIEPSRIYATLDGHIVISALTEQFWRGFASTIGLSWLIEDERFRTNKDRVAHSVELTEIVQPRMRERASSEWSSMFAESDVPFAQVNTLRDVLSDPQVRHSGMVREIRLTNGMVASVAGNPIKFGSETTDVISPAPILGEHTREILMQDCGLSDLEITELRELGIISTGSSIGYTAALTSPDSD